MPTGGSFIVEVKNKKSSGEVLPCWPDLYEATCR